MRQQISRITYGAMLHVAYHRLVIVQWLYDGDTDGGRELYEQLADEGTATDRVELVICGTKKDFLGAIQRVVKSTTTDNVPILHLVTHGTASAGCHLGGLGGCDPAYKGARESVTWAELAPLLTELAHQSDHRNFVMMTGCDTNDFIKYWKNPAARPAKGDVPLLSRPIRRQNG
jgi:hypothetical protein